MKDFLVRFEQHYSEALHYLKPWLARRDMQSTVAVLNRGMAPEYFDINNYLERSLIRYRRVMEQAQHGSAVGSWLEVGCLYPAFPIALALTGFEVTAAENYAFYGEDFLSMYREVEERFGVRFLDADLATTMDGLPPKHRGAYDNVSCLAVMEHLPHTPRYLLGNIRAALKPGGTFFCEVPHFYYWGNIFKALKGNHMQPPIELVYQSGIPFVGHHREYTLQDLLWVLRESGFAEFQVQQFNYSMDDRLHWREWLRYWPIRLDRFKELILVACTKPR